MLIDTNIIVEIAKKQQKHQECLDLLDYIKGDFLNEEIYMTRFTLHALEAIISKVNKEFLKEILLMIYQDKIKIFDTDIADDLMILASMGDLEFDFDDATQYVATNKLGTYIVSYDKSFNKKGIEVKTPKEILKKILK